MMMWAGSKPLTGTSPAQGGRSRTLTSRWPWIVSFKSFWGTQLEGTLRSRWNSSRCGGSSRLKRSSRLCACLQERAALNSLMLVGPCTMRLAFITRIWLTIWCLVISFWCPKLELSQGSDGRLIPLDTRQQMLVSLLRWASMPWFLLEEIIKILKREWMSQACSGFGDPNGTILEREPKSLLTWWLETTTALLNTSTSSRPMRERVFSLMTLTTQSLMLIGSLLLWLTMSLIWASISVLTTLCSLWAVTSSTLMLICNSQT